MTPTVSVIVPLYNKARTVRSSLLSICGQIYSDLEVIVVDDGSTDEGAAIVQSIQDRRIKLVSQCNAGPGAARNAGLRQASGDIVAFLDADDEWLPDYLSTLVPKLLQDTSLEAITAAWFDHPGMKSTVSQWTSRGVRAGKYRLSAASRTSEFISTAAFMSPCSTIARRRTVLDYGGFYEKDRCRYAEDVHLWLKVLLNHPVEFVMSPLAVFNRGSSELSGNYRGMRPIEPFLLDEADIRRWCPAPFVPLLEKFLAARAMKTACVATYWGDWRTGRTLRNKHLSSRSLREPITWLAILAVNPFGSLFSRALRTCLR